YIEDENGVPVSGSMIKQIFAIARSIWVSLHQDGQAPDCWGKVAVDARCKYEYYMCTKFPVLALGEANWKAHYICTKLYSSWFSTHV
ncbi:hypothetical protein NEOLEDRAFT_1019746, partial [Neolentinus lepideus HHB14362 ss-1]